MKKFLTLLFVLSVAAVAFAADVEVWQDPSLNFDEIHKIFLMPLHPELSAGTQLMPEKKLHENIISWLSDGIAASMGGKGKIIVKSYDALVEDMKFIYGGKVPEDSEFFKAASEMGYEAYIVMELSQEFATQHVPEQTRTYTEYRDIEKRDNKGRVIETIRIPEEKTEVIPAHDVTYLSTNCSPYLYMTKNYQADHVAAAKGSIYREYQGGPVMKVVENLVKASGKSLFAHEEKANTKTKRSRRK
ncbi:MAG: hypothetical protein IJP53_00745 [Synergistaceae bacterium]|nr:hypothetical protein [Synergistaceae bacterium]